MKSYKLFRIIKSTCLLLPVLLAAAGSANAAVFYVDKDATGANNGSSWANAWRSVTSVGAAKAGDIVYISGGSTSKTYTGVSDWQPPSGTTGNPVTFKYSTDAGHNGTVIFDGGNSSFFLRNGGTFHDIKFDFWDGTTQRLTITGYGTTVYADGAAGFTLLGANVSTPIRMAYGAVRYEIGYCYIDLKNGVDAAINLSAPGSAPGWGVNKIHNNTFILKRANSGSGMGDDGVQWGNSCDFYSNYFKGVGVASYTASQHQDGIQTDGRYTRAYANTFENMGNACFYPCIKGNQSDMYVFNNLFLRTDPALNGYQRGIDDGSDGSPNVTIANHQYWNNTFVGFNGLYAIGMYDHGLANVVFVNSSIGNNIFQDCPGGLALASSIQKFNNVYSGNTPNSGNHSGGGAGNVAFLSYAPNSTNINLHLAASASIAIDKGIPWPSAPFALDKDGNTRPVGSTWDVGAYEFTTGASATNLPPIVSPINQNAADVNPNVAGIQIYEGTVVQYSASASDPNGNTLTWQWTYTVNGGPQVVFQSGSGSVPSISFSYNAGTANKTYVWTLIVNDGSVSSQSSLTMGVQAPPSAQGLTIMATNGLITGPFTIGNNYISQPQTTTAVANGGSASYTFTVTNAGYYVIQTLVNAPDTGANSLFVNIDAVPVDPVMIWDVLTTSGFENRLVSWRGSNGTAEGNEFVPKVFNLGAGVHQLIVVGREANTQLRSFSILQLPSPPQNLRVLPNVVTAPSYSIGQ